MDRLDLELYADRLTRHADRLADDLAAARLRVRWSAFERAAGVRLDPEDAARLTAAGVLLGPASEADDRSLMLRRRAELAALERLQGLVEAELAEARGRTGDDRGR
jgi:hypothetical protein